MKRKFIFVLLILLSGSMPALITPIYAVDSVPAPVFLSVSPTGDPVNSMIYSINETLTVKYQADRFSVEKIFLLGSGSNLTADYNDGRALEFTKISSLKGNSTFEVEFNITSNTIFYAYAWSGSLDNGTLEEFDLFDGVQGHQLWISEGPSYPQFLGITGAEDRGSNFYAPLNNQVTIKYQVLDPHDNVTVTLSLGLNDTEVFNGTLGIQVVMNRMSHDSETNFTIFETNYTLTERIIQFSAFSDVGWERAKLFPDQPNLHILTNGFSFTKNFDHELDVYTDFDVIKLNVTSFNQTSDDEFFIRYRAFQNTTSDNPFLNWTNIALPANVSYSLNNDTNNYNTTEYVYSATLPEFNVSQVVEVQVYVDYKKGTFNESSPVRIEIKDARPTILFHSQNNTYLNAQNTTLNFEFENVRSDISSAELSYNGSSITEVKDLKNSTILFIDGTDTIIEGLFVVNMTAINDLNASRTSLFFYRLDTTIPDIMVDNIDNLSSDENGFVNLTFFFTDNLVNDSGLKYASLDWGDGVVIDVLNITQAAHKYRNNSSSGVYNVILTVHDIAGNINEIILAVRVFVPAIIITTENTPVNTLFGILSIGVMMLIIRKKRLLN